MQVKPLRTRVAALVAQIGAISSMILLALQGTESFVGHPFIPIERVVASACLIITFLGLSTWLMLLTCTTRRTQVSVITYGCILAGYLFLMLVSQVNDYHYRFKILLHHYSIANDVVFTPLFVLLGSKLIADNRQVIKIYIGSWIRPPCVQSLLLASMVCLASILLMPEPLMKAVYAFLISLRLDATAEHFALLIDQVIFPLPIVACILLIIACCCIFKYRSINFALCTLSFSATYGILMVFQNIIWFNATAGKALPSQFVFEMEKLVVLPVTFSIGVYWFLGFYAIVAMLMEAFRQKRL